MVKGGWCEVEWVGLLVDSLVVDEIGCSRLVGEIDLLGLVVVERFLRPSGAVLFMGVCFPRVARCLRHRFTRGYRPASLRGAGGRRGVGSGVGGELGKWGG